MTVIDSKNLTETNVLPTVLICNCKSADADNKCLYQNIQSSVNPYVQLVACQCNEYYSG